MPDVYFKKARYDYESLKPAIYTMIDAIGLPEINPASRVLIKPNFLLAAPPEKAVTTHPLIVKAVAEYIIEKGARPVIADSPATGSVKKVIQTGGYKEACADLNVEFKEFSVSTTIDIGEPFGKIEIAKEAMEADLVINLAKLKTHAMMTLTLGVKNLFGCIVGFRKPEWHVRAGVNRQIFANLILKISEAVNPSLTIIDGILSMEGQGPGKGGNPKQTGLIIGSSNTLAADMSVCRMLGIAPRRIPTLKAALDAGTCPTEITIHGDFKKISSFELPNQASFSFGPKKLHTFIRRHLVQRPVVEEGKCILCGECWQFCPVNAITENKVEFNYNTCIRCYCCIEVCPKGALTAKDPLPGKLIRQAGALWK